MLLAAVVLHTTLAQATGEFTLRPAPGASQQVSGHGVAGGTYVLAPKRPTFIDVQGPAALTLTLSGVVKKRGGSAVVVQVRGGKGGMKTVTLGGAVQAGVSVPKRPAFGLTSSKTVELEVGRGPQTVSVKVMSGMAVAVAVQTHVVIDDGASEDAEPSLVSKVGADTVSADEPSFVVAAPQPAQLPLVGPAGQESFFAVDAEHDFVVDASGPGLMSFDFHAHRSKARPETLEPVVVGVLLDDVLVQTLSIDRPEDPAFRLVGRDYGVTARTLLQLQVPPGRHRVALSISDNASLGASIRPRFEKLPSVRESVAAVPPPDPPEPPPAPPPPPDEQPAAVVIAMPASDDVYTAPLSKAHFGVLAGAWFPTEVATAGPAAQVEVVIEPARLVGIGVIAGFGYAHYTTSAAPLRTGDVDVNIYTVPITGDVRLRAPLSRHIALVVGGGAGARLSWGSTRSDGGESDGALKARLIAIAHASLTYATADGEWVLRGQYMPTIAANDSMRIYDGGATTVMLGYSF
jgi:hypothetical protein